MVLLTGALVVVVGSGMSGGAARLAGRNTASKKGHMVAPSMAALRQQSLSFWNFIFEHWQVFKLIICELL